MSAFQGQKVGDRLLLSMSLCARTTWKCSGVTTVLENINLLWFLKIAMSYSTLFSTYFSLAKCCQNSKSPHPKRAQIGCCSWRRNAARNTDAHLKTDNHTHTAGFHAHMALKAAWSCLLDHDCAFYSSTMTDQHITMLQLAQNIHPSNV